MKTYKLSYLAASCHRPEHPERTARRNSGGDGSLDFDIVFGVWTNRAAMARSIRLQEKRGRQSRDWSAAVPLSPGEGF